MVFEVAPVGRCIYSPIGALAELVCSKNGCWHPSKQLAYKLLEKPRPLEVDLGAEVGRVKIATHGAGSKNARVTAGSNPALPLVDVSQSSANRSAHREDFGGAGVGEQVAWHRHRPAHLFLDVVELEDVVDVLPRA